MKKVLVPVNYTENYDNTLCYADQLAAKIQAEVVLMQCAETPTLTQTRKSELLHRLRGEAARLQQKAGLASGTVKHECVVRPGWTQDCMTEAVKSYHIDLIVMSSEGVGQLADDAPVSLDQLERCPVLIVPPAAKFRSVQKIVFATDFADQDPVVLKKIAAFAALFDAELLLVHAYSEAERKELSPYKKSIAAIRKNLAYNNISFHVLEEDDVLEGISEFAEQNHADMLLMATQDAYLLQRLYAKDYAKTMAYHTRIPLLNFYQIKNNPCSGCCTNCVTKKQYLSGEATAL
ncbi:MAG: universal stress protein [Hymenobacteraceae bacterium]|nr:universal stress protein [Hymenobacteraceae bacterium]MDX5396829.1 universal stress protein [Hymenobacteraceae bacterium]MDX5512900.1 universal stress protein [Hymenobacteraceae bacterium]